MTDKVIVTITGPSGAGKSTLEKMLVSLPEFARVISVTTRDPRQGEENGKNYYFVSKETFFDMESKGAFLETANFNGDYYGATVEEFDRIFTEGKTPVVVVEPKGRAQIQWEAKHVGAEVISVFIDGAPVELIARQINREMLAAVSGHDWGKTVQSLSRRIFTACSQEPQWREEAYRSFDSMNPAYSMIFVRFDEQNDKSVRDTIAAAVVEQKLLRSMKEAA